MKFIPSWPKLLCRIFIKKWFEVHKSISISVVFTKKQCRKKCLPNIIYDGLLLFSCPAFQILIQKSTSLHLFPKGNPQKIQHMKNKRVLLWAHQQGKFFHNKYVLCFSRQQNHIQHKSISNGHRIVSLNIFYYQSLIIQ